MADITLYKDKNFGGRSESFSFPVDNLKNYGFNDETSSCKIPQGSTWMLYKDSNYQGDVSILGSGDYASADSMGLKNDSLSSLRPYPPVSGPTILLFKDSDFRGRMVVVTGAVSSLKTIDFNDEVSSIIVLSGNWVAYKDTDFKGDAWQLPAIGGPDGNGRYPEPDPFKNDAISSLKPV